VVGGVNKEIHACQFERFAVIKIQLDIRLLRSSTKIPGLD
jgi:hypothetical protein